MYIKKVANDFVREYYTRLHNSPSTLVELYAEDSSLVHGNEGDEQHSSPTKGDENIRNLLNREGFGNSKVCITDVTAVSVDSSTISVLVLGDMKRGEAPSKMFIQSFVLHYDLQRGHLVLADLLKFPQQESMDFESANTAFMKVTEPSLMSQSQTAANKEAVISQGNPAEGVNLKSGSSLDSSNTFNAASASTEPPFRSSKPPSKEPEEKREKARKFKFSLDTVAKAPSFRPKNNVPNYPMGYAIGGLSPNYSPAPAYQGIHPPMQLPLQYPVPSMTPQGNFIPPMQNPHIPPYRENSSPEAYRLQ